MESELQKEQQKSLTLLVSFMDNGNVTIVCVVIENSQILKAVDLQKCMNCEMQLNVVVNIHVAVHTTTFQHNKMCISLSEHPVCVLYTLDIYIHKRTHVALLSELFYIQQWKKSCLSSSNRQACSSEIAAPLCRVSHINLTHLRQFIH